MVFCGFFSGVYPISRQTHIESVASPGPFLLHQLVFSLFLDEPHILLLLTQLYTYVVLWISIYIQIYTSVLSRNMLYIYVCVYIYIYISNFTSSWDFVIFSEYWISRSRCNIWCSVPAQGSHEKKNQRHGLHGFVCTGSDFHKWHWST